MDACPTVGFGAFCPTKRLCRQIVLSATYSQDSRAPRELRDKDPANILLARGPAKRLSGERFLFENSNTTEFQL